MSKFFRRATTFYAIICYIDINYTRTFCKIQSLQISILETFVCVEVLRPCQQLRSCRAGQLPITTVPGQA